MNILDKLFSFFLELKPGKLIIGLLLMTLILIIIFPVIEQNFLYTWQMEKRIEILKEISEIDIEVISKDDRLKEEYNRIVNNLDVFDDESKSLSYLLFTKDKVNNARIQKFITGGILFWLMILIIPFADYKNLKSRIFALFILLFLGVIFGFIGMLIPVFYNRYINYIGFPLLQVIFLAWIVTSIVKSQSKNDDN